MDIVDNQLRQPQQVESQAREQEARRVYQELETACWAPWLQYAEEDLVGQVAVFPAGQLVVQDEAGNLAGSLSTNRINWSGETDSLPTWDGIAGQEEDFGDTYAAEGNTIALMSMNVAPEKRGERLPQKMIKQIQELAQKEDVQHLVGDFRPNNFGKYKQTTGDFDFAAYCQRTRDDGSFEDGWLRAVSRIGGKFLRPDYKSMIVEVSLEEFDGYRTGYTPEKWWQVTDPDSIEALKQQHVPGEQLTQIDEVWECEETGTWYIDKQNQKAVYIESNLWGELPIAPEKAEKHPARYDLSEEELERGQADLVREIETKIGKAEDLFTVWLNPRSPYSNVVRTFEAEKFPEVPSLVTDEVEDASQFLAIVDTRQGANRIIHATRISGVQAEKALVVDAEGVEIPQKTGIIMVDEIIDSDQDFTAKDFYKYYPEHGVDLAHCMGVETNFVIGEYPEKYNGLSSAQVGYLALFKLLEDKGMTTADGGVFANINIDSINSFAKLGLEYGAFVGRTDLKTPTVNEQGELDFDPKYQPVFVPANEHNSAIFAELHQIAGAPQLYL